VAEAGEAYGSDQVAAARWNHEELSKRSNAAPRKGPVAEDVITKGRKEIIGLYVGCSMVVLQFKRVVRNMKSSREKTNVSICYKYILLVAWNLSNVRWGKATSTQHPVHLA